MATIPKPTILLVHGAWHAPWCWTYQIPHLTALGYPTETIHLPSTRGQPGATQFDDAAHVRSVIDSHLASNKQVVILAHSYGGPIASAALNGLSGTTNVLGLIDLCAYIFPGGMDHGAFFRDVGGVPFVSWNSPSEGLHVLNVPRQLLFPPDTPEEMIKWAMSKLCPQTMASTLGTVPPQCWEDDPGYVGRLAYIRCTGDTCIPIKEQDGMVERAGGKGVWVVRTIEGSGHSPYLSRPEEVAAVVDEIVGEFEARVGRR